MDNNAVPFPQADDFEKVVKIINIESEERLGSNDYVGMYLDNITSRQVSYYVNAAIYLGLLTKDKKFTELGRAIREKNELLQKAELMHVLLADDVIGRVYVLEKILPGKIDRQDVEDLIREKNPNYCDAIYGRRAQTVLSWTAWINKNCKDDDC